MRKLFIFQYTLLLLSSFGFSSVFSRLQAQNIGVLDEKYAFRDVGFEKPLGEYKDSFTFVKEDENNKDIKIYTRSGEKLAIGDAKLKSVYYHFYKDKFYKVVLESEKGKTDKGGETNAEALLHSLFQNYGQANATEDKVLQQSYYWRGSKTFIEAKKLLTCTVIIYSHVVHDQINKDKQQRLRDSAKDW